VLDLINEPVIIESTGPTQIQTHAAATEEFDTSWIENLTPAQTIQLNNLISYFGYGYREAYHRIFHPEAPTRTQATRPISNMISSIADFVGYGYPPSETSTRRKRLETR